MNTRFNERLMPARNAMRRRLATPIGLMLAAAAVAGFGRSMPDVR